MSLFFMPLTVKELSSERDMMEKQKGVALIVVMSLLAVSLMIGLMSMQTSQVDERLAGNYKAAAEAQMHAEEAASDLYSYELISSGSPDLESQRSRWNGFAHLHEGFSWGDFEAIFDESHCAKIEYDHGEGIACYVEILDADALGLSENGDYIIALGAVGGAMAESEPVFVRLGSGLPQSVEDVLNNLGSDFYNVLTSYS